MAVLQLILDLLLKILVGASVSLVQSWQRDKTLQDLGYTKAQRDGALSSLKEVDAALLARHRAELARLDDPSGLRRPTGFERRSAR